MSQVSIKAEYNNQFRRFRLESDATLHQFYQTLSNVFQAPVQPSQVTIKYNDDEQDWVTIVQEEEFREAVRLCGAEKTMRVVISPSKSTVKKVIEEVEHIVGDVVSETGKIINKKTFEDAINTVKTQLDDPKLHEQLKDAFTQCTTAFESLFSEVDKGVKQVIDQLQPPTPVSVAESQDEQIEEEVEEVLPKPADEIKADQKPTQQPNMEQSWTFIEVNGDPSASVKRLPPNARFVRDVTFEDHTEVECGAVFTKQWEMQNSGTTAWPENIRIEFIHGQDGLFISANPVPESIKPDDKVTVSAELKAPQEEGDFKVLFRLTDGKVQFGPTLWCNLKAIKKQPTKWAAELKLLDEMGFLNREKNIKLLEEKNGDLSDVIQAHLSSF